MAPEDILADDNSRFNLKRTRLDTLKQSILELGGVQTPIEVAPIDGLGPNKEKFRLTAGFYRVQAVAELNKDEKAGLAIPAIVREVDDSTRLRHQLSENMDRENQSPMDRAVAIKKLMDSGMSRGEIRRLFSSTHGRKGVAVQPMSNAMLNMLTRLLELPKAIQEKIHDGRVGLEGAYILSRVPPDKRADVLAQAEKDRMDLIEQEDKDERRYLEAESKLAEVQAKAVETEKEVKTAQAEAENAAKLVEAKTAVLKEAKQMPGYLDMNPEEQKLAVEKMRAAEADKKAADKLAKEAKNTLAKVLKTQTDTEELAKQVAEKLQQARKVAAKPKKKPAGLGADAVKKAASKVPGAQAAGLVPLNLSDIRQALKDVSKAEYPRVAAIGKLLMACIDGHGFPKQLIEDLAVLTMEQKK